jgi:hypothetical protein
MPAGTLPPVTNGFQTFQVLYTATGSEGTDFNVPLGKTMADLTYSIAYRSAGGTSGSDSKQSSGVELLDIPVTGQQLGQFRIVLGSTLTLGDVLAFTISGTVS